MKLNVSHVAKLANLPITKAEEKKLEKQLTETLEYIGHLDEINTDNVKPTSHVTGLKNVLRTDVAKKSLSQKEALQNTKKQHQGFFQVNAVLAND